MADAEKLAAVREGLPSVGAGIYLNTPVTGPLPSETGQAMADISAWELTTGRAGRDRPDEVATRIDEARAGVAAIVGTDVHAIELTHGVGGGVRRVLEAIDVRAGHPLVVIGESGADPIVDLVSGRSSGAIKTTVLSADPSHVDDEELLDAAARAVEGARLVALPHVTATGRILQVGRLAALAREAGAQILVDGSQAVGAIPVAFGELGADYYVVPGWTWLLGPEGIGALAIGQRHRDGRRNAKTALPMTGEFHLPSIVGLARSCGWLSMYIGLDWIHRRGLSLAASTAERLGAVPGITVLTPIDRMATTVVFRIRGWTADDALDELGGRIFALASVVPAFDAIRIGSGFFNTEEEIERFVGGVELLASHPPGSLPPRRRLTIIGGDR
jgi:L-cysteine/cystine lyase